MKDGKVKTGNVASVSYHYVLQTSQSLGTINLEVEVSKPGDFSKYLEIDPIM